MPNLNVGLIAAIFIGILSSNAMAASYCSAQWISSNYTIENCIDGETLTFGGTTYETCFDCANGLSTYAVSFSDSQCSNKATKYLCQTQCTVKVIDSYILPEDRQISNCMNEAIIQFGTKQYHTCYDCGWGYRTVSQSLTNEACSNTQTIYACEEIPAEERECEDDYDCLSGPTGRTSADGSKYEYVTSSYCSNDLKCYEEDTAWSCSNGYYGGYGHSENSITCTRCPDQDGVYGYSNSPYNNSDITGCYIPKDTTLSDAVGSYVFTENCKASN